MTISLAGSELACPVMCVLDSSLGHVKHTKFSRGPGGILSLVRALASLGLHNPLVQRRGCRVQSLCSVTIVVDALISSHTKRRSVSLLTTARVVYATIDTIYWSNQSSAPQATAVQLAGLLAQHALVTTLVEWNEKDYASKLVDGAGRHFHMSDTVHHWRLGSDPHPFRPIP